MSTDRSTSTTLLPALAAGMRTSLSAMSLSLGSLRQELHRANIAGDRPVSEILDVLTHELRRAERLVVGYERLMSEPTLERVNSNLNAVVEQALAGAKEALQSSPVDLRVYLDSTTFEVGADRAVMLQAFGTLIRHAISSMGAGGVLTVTTRRDGDTWTLLVIDTGAGMSESDAQRLFDAGYSEGPGDRPGLGFALRALEAHGASVTCTSMVGHGTCVSVNMTKASVL